MTATLPAENERVTVIQPSNRWSLPNVREVWHFRDLMLMLIWRDISARYRQSIIGYGWAIVRPVLQVAIFTLVFSLLVRVETEVPYPLFAFAGMIPWMFFATTLTAITGSVVGGGSLLAKVYFPRVILPLSSIGIAVVDLLLQLAVMAVVMLMYRYPPTWTLLLLPLFVLHAILTAFAFGIWLTAWNVRYRDVGQMVPFLIQIWMYLCPIMYPLTLVPAEYQALYSVNPLVGVIEGFRWALIGGTPPDVQPMLISAAVLACVLFTGLVYFRRVETTFADSI